jgi:hypothetical protein
MSEGGKPLSIGAPEPTEFKIRGLLVKEFFDERFIRLLEEKIPDIKFEHVCFNRVIQEGDKKKLGEGLYIAHETPEDEMASITTIGAQKTDTTRIFITLATEFINEKRASK